MSFEAGTLKQRTEAVTAQALAGGSLQPIETEEARIPQGDITFLVRMTSSLVLKTLEKRRRAAEAEHGRPANPFLPCDPTLVVADFSPTHLGVLNKFPVIDHHLLIVTRSFEPQEQLLTAADFDAMWMGLGEIEGLGIYNGGTVAGASQPHKHLQIVPLPLSLEGPALPIHQQLDLLPPIGTCGRLEAFPFRHVAARLQPEGASTAVHECFVTLLQHLGMSLREDGMQPAPYNLLMQRDWMMVVPRSKEYSQNISVNALGYAGSMFVKNQEEFTLLKEAGPLRLLTEVGVSGLSS